MNRFSSKPWQKTFPDVPELESCTINITEKPEGRSLPTIELDRSSFETGSKEQLRRKTRPWKPLTQKTYFLTGVVLVSGGIIAALQSFLLRSNKDKGLIFAANIKNLPIGQAFCYLYLPTTVSLLLSFIWACVDLDVKRLQPYWQLSRKSGAKGKDSVLLHYPFDFVAFVPFKSIGRQYVNLNMPVRNNLLTYSRHWPVFSSSCAVVAILWGLTPLQSGMFATQVVHRTEYVPTISSTKYLPAEQQNELFTGSYAQSAYNIAWLNETLPAFMTRDGMLVPFGLVGETGAPETNEAWTGPSRMYSVDITCQEATYVSTNGSFLSDNGCDYPVWPPPTDIRSDQYMSTYVGFWYEVSMDAFLDGYCPTTANQTFIIQWGRGQQVINRFVSRPLSSTTLYCQSSYFQQDVNATVIPPHMAVSEVVATGPKEEFPESLLNITNFEWAMSSGTERFVNRGEYPQSDWPDATARLEYLDLALKWDYMPSLTGFAIAAYQRPASEYMDAQLLKDSYQAAYRLLLARRLSDIISYDLDPSSQSMGVRTYQTQAVVLVPTFVYSVEALIAITLIVAIVLIVLSYTTANSLRSDPANLASMMALIAEDPALSVAMGRYDRASSEDIEEAFEDSTFGLLHETKLNSNQSYGLKLFGHPSGARSVPKTILPGEQLLPKELRWTTGLAFLIMQIVVVTLLSYAYIRAQKDTGKHFEQECFVWTASLMISPGLPLPSSSRFINQIVEKYVPMVVAAFFEPIWLVLNRLICMLKPYEQLRKGRSTPSQSLTTDYNSLPPQAVIGRALKAGHLSLAMICTMALLANILSIAFNSLMFEETVAMSTPAIYSRNYQLPMHNTSLGNESFAVQEPDYDSYYIAMSNFTANTSLPPWTDHDRFYLPFSTSSSSNMTGNNLQAATTGIGASVDCVPLTSTGPNTIRWWFGGGTPILYLNATLSSEDGSSCNLSTRISIMSDYRNSYVANSADAFEVVSFAQTGTSSLCRTSLIAGWLRANDYLEQYFSSSKNGLSKYNPSNGSWIACTPKVDVAQWRVTVNSDGNIQDSPTFLSAYNTTKKAQTVFEPSEESFILSFHKSLSLNVSPLWASFHNDSYPSEFFNYIATQVRNSSAFLDPSLPPPSPEDMASTFSTVYNTLFAITLGTNIERLFSSATDSTMDGSILAPETRIFFSKPMFVLSIIILALYLVTTVVLYMRRPWRILPRMPTSIANQVAFFACSHALEDLTGTAAMTASGRDIYINDTGHRYGFGRFLGTDSRGHIGIEREPLVQIMRKDDLKMQRGEGEEAKGAWGWIRG